MKGVVLCGGTGTRLRPVTYSTPKEMLPIANVPIIEYILKEIVRCGIRSIGIVIGDDRGITSYIKDGRDMHCRIKYFIQPKPMGTANALLYAKSFLDDDEFIVIPGNIFFDFHLDEHIRKFENSRYDALYLTSDNRDVDEYNVEDGKKVCEKSNQEFLINNINVTGIYLFNSSIFKAASKIKPSQNGEYEINDAVRYLINKDYRVGSVKTDGICIDIERPRDILNCSRYVLSGYPDKHIVGENTVVDDSKIGEYVSIGSRCIIKNSIISNSIIMDDCIINGLELYDSIVCSHSTIAGSGSVSGVFAANTNIYINN